MFAHYQTPIFEFVPGTGGTVTDTVINGTTYRVHTFTTSGTFSTSTTNLPLTVLLVGGGGGGGAGSTGAGQNCGGGGGAGGYISIETNVPASTNYSIVIGSGGTGGDGGASALAGNSTTGFSYTALGGGIGAQRTPNTVSGQGGSGGGGFAFNNGGTTGNTSIQFSTYGYGQGGSGASGSEAPAGIFRGGSGGGGGGNAAYLVNGPGVINNITGANVTYAPGGGGGLAQPSSSNYVGANTLPNYGAGGGGGTSSQGPSLTGRTTGATGADGVVIIRYPLTTV
jgi:hypothetical protein